MSSTVAVTPERERFPEIEAAIGEDPARFLDTTLVDDRRELVVARIRGIDGLDVVDAWIQVEQALDRDRESVRELLERRRDWLLEHGDRKERLDGERSPAAPKEVVWIDEDGEPYDRSTSASSKIAQMGGQPSASTDDGSESDRQETRA